MNFSDPVVILSIIASVLLIALIFICILHLQERSKYQKLNSNSGGSNGIASKTSLAVMKLGTQKGIQPLHRLYSDSGSDYELKIISLGSAREKIFPFKRIDISSQPVPVIGFKFKSGIIEYFGPGQPVQKSNGDFIIASKVEEGTNLKNAGVVQKIITGQTDQVGKIFFDKNFLNKKIPTIATQAGVICKVSVE